MRPILKVFFFGSIFFLFLFCTSLDAQTNPDFDLQGFKGMQAIIDDFLVNDDSVGNCNQYLPAIACDSSGNFVITWVDERDATNLNIYAQRFDSSGIPLSSVFIVNDDTSLISQNYPDVAMDISGNFVITWASGRICAQRYNNIGTPLGSNFNVSLAIL